MHTDLVSKAIKLSEEWHHDQRRYDGTAYILHPRWVAEKLLEHRYDDDVTQCMAHLHDTVEMVDNRYVAILRMGEIYIRFGYKTSSGVYVLSENMGNVGKQIAVKTDAYKKRLISSRKDIQRVAVTDFLHNSTDLHLHIYKPKNRDKRIREADIFYIPLALKVAPKIAKELIEVIEGVKAKV